MNAHTHTHILIYIFIYTYTHMRLKIDGVYMSIFDIIDIKELILRN